MFSRMRTKNTMKRLYEDMPNGYQETIQKGLSAVRYFSRNMSCGHGTKKENIQRLKEEIEPADAIVIGAGAGLSTSAGFVYSGERFEKWFSDYAEKLSELMQNPQLILQMGALAKHNMERFSEQEVMGKWEKLFSQLTKGKK